MESGFNSNVGYLSCDQRKLVDRLKSVRKKHFFITNLFKYKNTYPIRLISPYSTKNALAH